MPDTVTPEIRSRMMAGIRGKDTGPEMFVRRALHRLGFRFRLHDRRLPGRPDLVFRKYRAVIFIHGCFWHGHDCPLFRPPGSRVAFWKAKIEGNRARDVRSGKAIRALGWRRLTIWECAIRGKLRRDKMDVVRSVAKWLTAGRTVKEIQGYPHGRNG